MSRSAAGLEVMAATVPAAAAGTVRGSWEPAGTTTLGTLWDTCEAGRPTVSSMTPPQSLPPSAPAPSSRVPAAPASPRSSSTAMAPRPRPPRPRPPSSGTVRPVVRDRPTPPPSSVYDGAKDAVAYISAQTGQGTGHRLGLRRLLRRQDHHQRARRRRRHLGHRQARHRRQGADRRRCSAADASKDLALLKVDAGPSSTRSPSATPRTRRSATTCTPSATPMGWTTR